MEQWSIYVIETVPENRDPVRDFIFGKDRHSFLMLVNEASKEPLKELHFSSAVPDGSDWCRPTRSLNVMAHAADAVGLLPVFKKAVDKIGAGNHLRRIKGVQVHGEKKLQDVNAQRVFIGSPQTTMNLWNTACREAIALNMTDTPFLARGIGKPAVNCRAGTEMALESMNLRFNIVASGAAKRGLGRHLRREIKGLDRIHPPATSENLEHQLKRNEALAKALFETRAYGRHRKEKIFAHR